MAASVAYTCAYYFNWPLFTYFPTVNQILFFAHPQSGGLQILWYGWLSTAALIGAVVAFTVPHRWVERIPPDLCWLLAIVLIVALLAYEKRWFI
jgi:hypothetical protein